MTSWVIAILGLLNGGYMLFDGWHVMTRNTYFGPKVPGPWRLGFEALGIDVFRLGPLFVAFGLLWLGAVAGYAGADLRWPLIAIAVLTLWYLPIGTLISLMVLFLVYRQA